MKFSGLQKISLIDYPNKIASVLFTPGCNMRCGFCHNWRIATDPQPPFLQEATALEMLENRKKIRRRSCYYRWRTMYAQRTA